MYKINVNSLQKRFEVNASGMFKKEEAIAFLDELEEKIKTINPKEYTLVINAKDQKPSTPNVVPLQEKSIKLYVSTPFAKRYSIVIDSAITNNQIKRLGKEELLENITFIQSIEEVK